MKDNSSKDSNSKKFTMKEKMIITVCITVSVALLWMLCVNAFKSVSLMITISLFSVIAIAVAYAVFYLSDKNEQSEEANAKKMAEEIAEEIENTLEDYENRQKRRKVLEEENNNDNAEAYSGRSYKEKAKIHKRDTNTSDSAFIPQREKVLFTVSEYIFLPIIAIVALLIITFIIIIRSDDEWVMAAKFIPVYLICIYLAGRLKDTLTVTNKRIIIKHGSKETSLMLDDISAVTRTSLYIKVSTSGSQARAFFKKDSYTAYERINQLLIKLKDR